MFKELLVFLETSIPERFLVGEKNPFLVVVPVRLSAYACNLVEYIEEFTQECQQVPLTGTDLNIFDCLILTGKEKKGSLKLLLLETKKETIKKISKFSMVLRR